MSKLKFLLCLGVLFSIVLISSCSKDDDKNKENPGEIAGLGNQEGQLQGSPFNLPSGIKLNGTINGYSSSWPYSTDSNRPTSNSLKKQSAVPEQPVRYAANHDIIVGSGHYVEVLISLQNTTNTNKDVTFPARLILKSKFSSDQNGVLLKDTKVAVPANSAYNVVLLMYCGNLSKSPSSTSSVYEWGVISNSKLLKEMTDILADKKINIEEFNSNSNNTYSGQESKIQNILWNITDSQDGMTKENKTWLQALPKAISK